MNKIKKFKKWILGLLIPITVIPLGAIPPEDTIYKVEWREQFATEQAFLRVALKYPEIYPNWVKTNTLKSWEKDFVIIVWREFPASTTEQARLKLKEFPDSQATIPGSRMEAQTLLTNYVEKYKEAELFREMISKGEIK